MAMKLIRDTLDGLPEWESKHYEPTADGKFTLVLEEGPVELGASAKVTEFREKNVALLKALARFDGIEPDAVRADRARLAELERGQTDTPARLAALEAELAQERTARAATEQAASRARVRDSLRPKALAIGAIPAAVEMLLDKAEPLFTIVNDAVHAKPNTFSRTRPGEPITPEDFFTEAVAEFPFLFRPSRGGGAGLDGRNAGTVPGVRELRDPSPQDLGRYADDIKSGAVRVVHSS